MEIKENITIHLSKSDIEEIIKDFLKSKGYNSKSISFKLSSGGGDWGMPEYKNFNGADCSVSKI